MKPTSGHTCSWVCEYTWLCMKETACITPHILTHACIYTDNLKDQNATGRQPDSEMMCTQGFYFENDSHPMCVPLCASWVIDPETLEEDVIFVVSMVVAIVSSTILFVAMWPQRDTM